MKNTLKKTVIVGLVYQNSIRPAHGGFGMFSSEASGPSPADGYYDVYDILAHFDGLSVELVDGAVLPDGVSDIRGNIYNEPARVFALVEDDGEVSYCGFDTIDTICDAVTGDAIAFDGIDDDDLANRGYAPPDCA